MTNSVIKSVLAGALLLGTLAGQAQAGATANVTISNTNSEVSIVRVWFAVNGSYDYPWIQANSGNYIGPRNSRTFSVSNIQSCYYDFKVQFSDGYVKTFGAVDMCNSDPVLRAT